MKTYNPLKISYPCYCQPKLNGVFAELSPDGWIRSKTGKYFPAVQHLFNEVKPCFILQGELYVHGWPLQDILSAVSPDVPNALSNQIQFWVYDINVEEPQFRRRALLVNHVIDELHINLTPTNRIENTAEGNDCFAAYLDHGYEGMIYRDWNAYPGEGVTKRKPFFDEEFLCIDVIEGKGKRKGHVGRFVLKSLTTGVVFNCGGGQVSYNDLANYWINPPLNKLLTVRYSYKSKDGIPQAAQFIRVRDNLDL